MLTRPSKHPRGARRHSREGGRWPSRLTFEIAPIRSYHPQTRHANMDLRVNAQSGLIAVLKIVANVDMHLSIQSFHSKYIHILFD